LETSAGAPPIRSLSRMLFYSLIQITSCSGDLSRGFRRSVRKPLGVNPEEKVCMGSLIW
jgi:hypothetical protein